MAPARKVFTEAMVRRVLKAHYEIEPEEIVGDVQPAPGYACNCTNVGTSFEDHFIDQLHKLWHEMFNRRPTTTPTDSNTIVEVPT